MRNDLAALVGSRICHDLISPIGAIGNGVELLSLTDGDTSAEMALISQSVESAGARIKFFRIAFGAATEAQMVGRNDILSILAASARGGRFTYYWRVDGDQPRRDVRAAFLLMQCFETALPMGGDIEITCQGDSWRLVASAPRINANPELWEGLVNPRLTIDHTPSQVQFALLPTVIKEAMRTLTVSVEDERIVARF